jgi:hypothetical protein
MREPLILQSSYLNRTQLASFYIETPDPQLQFPLVGQYILAQWYLPKTYLCFTDLHLLLTIRFGNRSEIQEKIYIWKTKGWYQYFLRGQEFLDKQGILTYKAILVGSGQILESWQHQLWAEKIVLDPLDETMQQKGEAVNSQEN